MKTSRHNAATPANMAAKPDELSEPHYYYFDELPSTNQKMKELTQHASLPDMSVVVARHQYAGRGQMGNSWESEAGCNLTFSLTLNPTFLKIQSQFLLSQTVSVGIVEALHKLGLTNAIVKWPNDIYVDDRKLAGILIENSIIGNHLERCTIGIGLNVNQTKFVSNAPNPVSMAMIAGKTFNLSEVLECLLDGIFEQYMQLQLDGENDLKQSYLALMYRNDGNRYPFSDANGPFLATIQGIDEYGRLMLKKDNGQVATYEFKEVEYLKNGPHPTSPCH